MAANTTWSESPSYPVCWTLHIFVSTAPTSPFLHPVLVPPDTAWQHNFLLGATLLLNLPFPVWCVYDGFQCFWNIRGKSSFPYHWWYHACFWAVTVGRAWRWWEWIWQVKTKHFWNLNCWLSLTILKHNSWLHTVHPKKYTPSSWKTCKVFSSLFT